MLFALAGALALQLGTCTIEAQPVRCGVLRVPEDPARPGGREIPLNVIVLPRRGIGAPREPLFFLGGGPGTAMTSELEWVSRTFGALRDERDLVLVDQRGTGGSNRLDCAVAPETFLVPLDPAACLQQLSAFADPRLYTTELFIADLERVRQTLGYERIALYGGSYGTRAAYVYARQHPGRIAALVLVAAAPLSMSIIDTFFENGRSALDARVAQCEDDPECRKRHPRFASDVATIRRTLTSNYYAVGIGFLMYAPDTGSQLPAILSRAARGELGPLRAAIDAFREWVIGQTDIGLHLSVMCREEVPLATHRLDAGLGAEYARACGGWPIAALPASFHDMPKLRQPALVIAGELDPVTPPRFGRIVADRFSPGQLVVIPGAGHQGLPWTCVASMTQDFLGGRAVDSACVKR